METTTGSQIKQKGEIYCWGNECKSIPNRSAGFRVSEDQTVKCKRKIDPVKEITLGL